MQHENDAAPKPRNYAEGIRIRGRRDQFAVLWSPAIYVVAYVGLRTCGVFYPFYNQGGWDIDGTTHVHTLDIMFSPAALVEGFVQSSLRWLQEPAGG